MKRWSLIVVLSAVLWSILAHPLAWRFAMGDWPVPTGTPWTYQLESGFIPALTVLTLLSAVASMYHIHNCHYEGCWRLGKHRVNGTPWCSHHVGLARPEETVENKLDKLIELTRHNHEASQDSVADHSDSDVA